MIGVVFIWGSIAIYVASYFRQYSKDITTRDLLLCIPLWGLYEITFWPLSSFLQKKYATKLYIYIYINIYIYIMAIGQMG